MGPISQNFTRDGGKHCQRGMHRHIVRHDADTDTDILADIVARIVARMSAWRSACHRNNFRKSRVSDVLATILARMSVSVPASVSWNAGFILQLRYSTRQLRYLAKLARWSVLTVSRSSWKVNFEGQSSRSPDDNVSKLVGCTDMMIGTVGDLFQLVQREVAATSCCNKRNSPPMHPTTLYQIRIFRQMS